MKMVRRMNNEDLVKLIDSNKEVLSTLPKNNKKNISKYIEMLKNYKEEYSEIIISLKKEIERRRDVVVDKINVNKDLDNLKKKVSKLEESIYLFNDYNSSYEKSGLDKLLYNLSGKSNKNLMELNSDIAKCLEKFKDVGISLSDNDFKYAPSAYSYMKEYFSYIDDLDNDNLKNSFEKIYWKFPDIIVHIELSFKYLYYKNEKSFDKYFSNLKLTINKECENNLIENYKKIKINYDQLVDKDIYTIFEKFLSKEYNVIDYKEDKIRQSIVSLIDLDLDKNYEKIINNISKLYNSIKEYQNYLTFKYVFDEVKELYKDKDKYKDVVKNKKKEIAKNEKKLFKLNRKIYNLMLKSDKERKLDRLYMETSQIISTLKELYDSLEKDKFNEQIMMISDNSEIIEVFKLANSYYIFHAELLMKINGEISLLDINNRISELSDYINSPYNTIINNTDIINDNCLDDIICNIYNLNNFMIEKDNLDDDSKLDSLLSSLKKILVFDSINRSVINVEDIEYVCVVENLFE